MRLHKRVNKGGIMLGLRTYIVDRYRRACPFHFCHIHRLLVVHTAFQHWLKQEVWFFHGTTTVIDCPSLINIVRYDAVSRAYRRQLNQTCLAPDP